MQFFFLCLPLSFSLIHFVFPFVFHFPTFVFVCSGEWLPTGVPWRCAARVHDLQSREVWTPLRHFCLSVCLCHPCLYIIPVLPLPWFCSRSAFVFTQVWCAIGLHMEAKWQNWLLNLSINFYSSFAPALCVITCICVQKCLNQVHYPKPLNTTRQNNYCKKNIYIY